MLLVAVTRATTLRLNGLQDLTSACIHEPQASLSPRGIWQS